MQGLPGSGKSTVAQQLAGKEGKIFALDKTIMEQKKSLLLADQTSL
jgi:adenylate kinase family enzyme